MLSIVKMISAPNQIENVASIIIIGLFIYFFFGVVDKSGSTGCRISRTVTKMGRGWSRDSSQRSHRQRWNVAQNWIASPSRTIAGTVLFLIRLLGRLVHFACVRNVGAV